MQRNLLTIAALPILLAGCATATKPLVPPTTMAEVGEVRAGSGYAKGYLAPAQLPDSLALLPPPPSADTPAMSADEDGHRKLNAMAADPRGRLAASDAVLKFPGAAQSFACALGVTISEERTPNLNMLLRRSLTDAGLATYRAKDTYQRVRPYVHFKTGTCLPEDEAHLAKDGSYPSGHSSIGWAWALILTQAAPDRQNQLLQRGRAFTQSRSVRGYHWRSDIEAGRLIGAATVARLQSDPVFQSQLSLARDEITRARAGGATPDAKVCADEAAALAVSSRLGP